MHKDEELADEETREIDAYINSIIKTRDRPFQIDSKPRITLAKLRFFMERAYKSFFIERLRTPYSKPWRGLYNYVMKLIRSKLSRFLYSRPDYNEKYIFFPLNVEYDAPVLVWNPIFMNQLFLIEIISRNLPVDYTLYVKEHPNDIGGNSLTKLYKIKKIPKVKLINATEDSHKLIRNSSAVLVVAGTPGWEALLLEKSVIGLGRAYYDPMDIIWKVRDLSKLGDTIKKAITESRYDKNILYRFISAYGKVSYPGMIYFTQLYRSNESNRDFVLSEENIRNVADGIRKQITEDAYLLD